MATANPAMGLHGPGIIKKASGWFIAIAVVFIILGIMAIAEPAVAGLAVAILVGWLLILGGVAHLVATFAGGGAELTAAPYPADVVQLSITARKLL